jgi:hypothetical protein
VPVLTNKALKTSNKTSTKIKVTNCGYIHLLGVISMFYKIFLVESSVSTQLECNTFAESFGEDLIYGIRFSQYQIRLTHICDDKLCSTDEINLDIYLQTQTRAIRLQQASDVPPVVMNIYQHLIRYMQENN